MADLGDLSGFLREGSVADLSWLEVSEKDREDLRKIPMQNLDYAPQLEAAWAHEDVPRSRLVPTKTMRSVAEAGGPPTKYAAQVERFARLTLLQTDDVGRIREALLAHFDADTLKANRSVLAAVLDERGLLGRYYVAAEDFPSCATKREAAAEFVRRNAPAVRYLLAKKACGGCAHAAEGRCGVFRKELVVEVPYGEADAARVERDRMASGRQISASEGTPPRERIRAAMLAPEVKAAALAETPKPVLDPARALRPVEAPKRVHLPVLANARQAIAAKEMTADFGASNGKTASAKVAWEKKAFEVTALLRREMLRGRSERDLVAALRLTYSAADLQATRSAWEPMFREAGFYGTLYTTPESFDACRDGAAFVAKHNPSLRAVVASEKCGGCAHNRLARCGLYDKPLVESVDSLRTAEMVASVLDEHRRAGRLPATARASDFPSDPTEALKTLYRQAMSPAVQTALSSKFARAHVATRAGYATSDLTKREIVKVAQRYLNEGLYGSDLLSLLRRRFDPRDLVASREDLRPVLAEQGLQGIHYVDPTVYADYGKGCKEVERLHRGRVVAYVKQGEACSSCVHQTQVGHCSRLNKTLVDEPPYQDKSAQQRAVLASGRAAKVEPSTLVAGNKTVLAEYEMGGGMTIELDAPKVGPVVAVALGRGKHKL